MKRRIKKALFFIYKLLFSILGVILKKDEKIIVFESFLGRQFSDNPRAIYEYLKENDTRYKMYWSVDKHHIEKFNQANINYIRRFSLKWMILMNRAKYWVTNSRLPLWIPKPIHTIYVQTWHGTPLKKLALDMEEVHMPAIDTETYKRNFLKEVKKWDYLISPNQYSTEIFKRAFQFDKKIIESGYPRNDYLINNNNKKQIKLIKSKLQIPTEKKVILYAPTWRDNQFYDKGRYKFDIQMDLNLLRQELSEEYIIILRLHYLVAENLDLSTYEGFVYDFSHYEDIRDLYLISDLLITDYSSVFFDFANLKRPMIFYVYDIDEYRDRLRGFYFDFEKQAPGPLVQNTKELINAIKNIEHNFNEEEFSSFYNKFCYLDDGFATERVVDEIFNKSE